ncbi:MAG: B12-binding domain-containing radical SAM protein [Elusimicrobia bacterium]|nr:B12-binding domain-containing radical SAM protein [Elusimicrobiota bacterium]
MTDILFVQNYYEQTLGIMQISACLKKNGFETDIAIGTRQDIIKKTLAEKPKVIGFYCTTGFHHRNISIAAEIKKILGDKILTLFGGPHPTFVPDMIKAEGVDIICRGEGESAVLELLQALKNTNDYTGIKNLTVKKEGKIYENEVRPFCDINTLPHPDREIYRDVKYIYKNKRQEVMFGRGCPFDCTFCSTHVYREIYKGKGNYVRFRAIPDIIAEFKDIKNKYRSSCFFFNDDTFIFKKDYCAELLNTYKKEIGLPFACHLRADLVTDDLMKLLKETGCYFAYFGIESGNEELRNLVLKKNISDKHILDCASLLHKYKIPFATFNMVGLPGEALREVWDTVNINVKVKPVWAWFSVYQTLPRTELAQYALDKGCISSVDVSGSDATFHESSIIIRNNSEGKRIMRLKNIANFIIKFPFLKMPAEKIFLNMPFDMVYDLIDKALYFISYYSKLTYKLGFFRSLYSAFFIVCRLKEFK